MQRLELHQINITLNKDPRGNVLSIKIRLNHTVESTANSDTVIKACKGD